MALNRLCNTVTPNVYIIPVKGFLPSVVETMIVVRKVLLLFFNVMAPIS